MNSTTSGTATFSAQKCPHCDGWHNGTCPSVRAIEYWPNGTIKRIEYERGQGMILPLPLPFTPPRPLQPTWEWRPWESAIYSTETASCSSRLAEGVTIN